MRFTLPSQRIQRAFVGAITLAAALPAWSQATPPDKRLHTGKLLYADDFRHGLSSWKVEMEESGRVSTKAGRSTRCTAGVTVWFRPRLEGPVMIQYQATVVSAGGPNDRVSDLNSFWMATDPRSPDDLFARMQREAPVHFSPQRNLPDEGGFWSITRFDDVRAVSRDHRTFSSERYLCRATPLQGHHRQQDPNRTLIADGHLIQYWCDEEKIFEMTDPQPYTSGWFGIRTKKPHAGPQSANREPDPQLAWALQGDLTSFTLGVRHGRYVERAPRAKELSSYYRSLWRAHTSLRNSP
jgi:hypothetical protein